jgi:hypothetical protein
MYHEMKAFKSYKVAGERDMNDRKYSNNAAIETGFNRKIYSGVRN